MLNFATKPELYTLLEKMPSVQLKGTKTKITRYQIGMAPAGAGTGLAKTRPQANPRDWKKPAREQTRGCISAPAPAPADFGRVSGARGSNNRYNKNVQIHQFKQSNNTFL